MASLLMCPRVFLQSPEKKYADQGVPHPFVGPEIEEDDKRNRESQNVRYDAYARHGDAEQVRSQTLRLWARQPAGFDRYALKKKTEEEDYHVYEIHSDQDPARDADLSLDTTEPQEEEEGRCLDDADGRSRAEA